MVAKAACQGAGLGEAELLKRGVRYVMISGSDWADREAQAVRAIIQAYPGLERPA